MLLYYPFLDVGEGTLANDEEILTNGYLKDVEGPLPVAKEDANPAKAKWAKKVYPVINQLEANGITWAWVNDASIQAAKLDFALTKNNERIADSLLTPVVSIDEHNAIQSIDKWTLQTDSVTIKDTALFDWKKSSQLQFSSAEGIYTSTFQWQPNNAHAHYFLDMGKVYYTAEVYLNGTLAGKRIYSPYILDITSFLKLGTNEIVIRVTPGQLNGFIGKAKSGDARYRQFKGKEDQVMSAGLIGPVVIRAGK